MGNCNQTNTKVETGRQRPNLEGKCTMEGYMSTKNGTDPEEHQKHGGEASRQNASHCIPFREAVLESHCCRVRPETQQKQDKGQVFSDKEPLCLGRSGFIASRRYLRNVKNVCFNVTRFGVCILCIIGGIVCGCTVSPWNSICVVNALFKAINTLSSAYTQEEHGVFCLTCVCLRLPDAAGEDAWACVWAAGPPSDRLLAAAVWRALRVGEASQNEEKHAHFKLFHPSWQPLLTTLMHNCISAACNDACTWSQLLCVWCGLWRTPFKENSSALKSRSFFLSFISWQLEKKQAGMEPDTWPTFSICHVL